MKNALSTIGLLLFSLIFVNCKSTMKDISAWTEDEVKEWFNAHHENLSISPDSSIDKRMFIQQYLNNEKAWQTAYEFLLKTDLGCLNEGKYNLLDDGTYATITDYQTKDQDTAKYEAHQKYVDIQFVVSGDEYIEILPLDMLEEKPDYDSTADIKFFESTKNGEMRYADNTCFFIFFPENVHKPCLQTDSVKTVRKLVVKVPFIDIRNK